MAKPRFTRRCDCVRGVGMFRAGGLVSSVLICGLSASEAICQIEQQEQSRSPISVDMRRAKPLGWQEEQALRPLDMFKECEVCPEMIVVPAGEFMMGAPETEDDSEDNERPEHKVTIAKPFSVGRFAVTFEEWEACVADGGCRRYAWRSRLGARSPTSDQSMVGRREGLHEVAVGKDGQGLPAFERSRARICDASGNEHAILVGSVDLDPTRKL